jgi:FkbM family methyltransferase
MGSTRKLAQKILPAMLVEAIQSRTAAGSLQLWIRRFARQSFAQDSEDLLVISLLADSSAPGFYVDVGAHHPARFSNTLLFYLMGWRGINIDPIPGGMALFKKWRPRDINLEIGISEFEQELTYHMFNDGALNTFSDELASSRSGLRSYRRTGTVPVPTQPLRTVFSRHVPPDTTIDFLTVDVEGMDLDVLRSNDWNRWRPSVVLAEEVEVRTLDEVAATDIARFMREVGYVPCAKTRFSLCFAEESRLQLTDIGLQVRRPAHIPPPGC